MKVSVKNIYKLAFLISLFDILLLFFDFGFEQSKYFEKLLNAFYFVVISLGIISIISRHIFEKYSKKRLSVLVLDGLLLLALSWIIYHHITVVTANQKISFWFNDNWIILGIILIFFREISEHEMTFKRHSITPPQLFILSFIIIILFGALLLMMPKATYNGISFLNALFTSTSAVCVTGLVVVDTATYFTPLGQGIILLLIQIGGLGILTMASYFSYFFKGGSSYENQLIMGNILNTNKLGEVFSTLKHVLIITFSIELLSAILIYLSIEGQLFNSFPREIFFSVFHSISAFCNAGFSTFSNNLFESSVRTNYLFQIVICFTFIFGGLGFPIVVNILKYLKHKILRILPFTKTKIYKPWLLSLNSRIALITTFGLTLSGTIFFYFLEYDHAFANQNEIGKWVTAFFTATTPRTAGFNTIDLNTLHLSTLMLMFLLMWIGASPASTGGGIKTNTFAVAFLNVLSLGRGKENVEIFRRRIAPISLRRASAVIILSLVVIGMGIMFISIFDEDKELLDIAFECFSAYSTVGLSLGITAQFTSMSKLVLIFIMLIGRVSMLTVVIALMRPMKQKAYQYPTEEISIN